MPVVFIHGVPDTDRVWRSILERINRSDVVSLSLPGFGNAVPPGFGATKEEYVAWLAATLEALKQPIDLVGHDWGSLLAVRDRRDPSRSGSELGWRWRASQQRLRLAQSRTGLADTPSRRKRRGGVGRGRRAAISYGRGRPRDSGFRNGEPCGCSHEGLYPETLPVRKERLRGMGGGPGAHSGPRPGDLG